MDRVGKAIMLSEHACQAINNSEIDLLYELLRQRDVLVQAFDADEQRLFHQWSRGKLSKRRLLALVSEGSS